jgi:hypothetical protein
MIGNYGYNAVQDRAVHRNPTKKAKVGPEGGSGEGQPSFDVSAQNANESGKNKYGVAQSGVFWQNCHSCGLIELESGKISLLIQSLSPR